MDCNGLPGTEAGETGHVYELDRTTCKRWFGDTGRYGRVGTIGEGSCFFHSLCFAMNKDGYPALTESDKKKLVHAWRCKTFGDACTKEAFKKHSKNQTEAAFKTFKKKLCNPTTWADETMIRFASELTDTNIVFLDLRNKETYCGLHHDKVLHGTADPVPTIVVAWVNREHFEPIVRIADASGTLHTMFDTDDSMVRHLMGAYKSKCEL
jgi:hypothetical protein